MENNDLSDIEKDELIERIGVKMRSTRREKNLTQQQLGDLASLSYKYIGEIERAEKNPSIKVLARIANALQIDLLDLIGGDPVASTKKDQARENALKRITRILKEIKTPDLEKIVMVLRILSER